MITPRPRTSAPGACLDQSDPLELLVDRDREPGQDLVADIREGQRVEMQRGPLEDVGPDPNGPLQDRAVDGELRVDRAPAADLDGRFGERELAHAFVREADAAGRPR